MRSLNHGLRPSTSILALSTFRDKCQQRYWQLLLFSTFFALTRPLYAQDTVEPKATQLLAACRNAMGSPDRTFALSGIGSITYPGASSPVIQLTFRTTGSRLAIWNESAANKTLTRQWNGGKSQIIGTNGKKTPLSVSGSMYRIPELIPAFACNEKATVLFSSLQWVSTEQKDGQSVDHLHIRMDDKRLPRIAEAMRDQIQSFELYLDSQTHVVVAISRYVASNDALENRIRTEWRYSGYQQVSGVLIPTSIQCILDGQQYDQIRISSVSTGTALSEADFQ